MMITLIVSFVLLLIIFLLYIKYNKSKYNLIIKHKLMFLILKYGGFYNKNEFSDGENCRYDLKNIKFYFDNIIYYYTRSKSTLYNNYYDYTDHLVKINDNNFDINTENKIIRVNLCDIEVKINSNNIFNDLDKLYPNNYYRSKKNYYSINKNISIDHFNCDDDINKILNNIYNKLFNTDDTNFPIKIYIYGDHNCGKTYISKLIINLYKLYLKNIKFNIFNAETYNYDDYLANSFTITNYNKILNYNFNFIRKYYDKYINRVSLYECDDILNNINKKNYNKFIKKFYHTFLECHASDITIFTSTNFIQEYSDRYDFIIKVKKCNSDMIRNIINKVYKTSISDDIIFKNNIFDIGDVVNLCFDNPIDISINKFIS